MTQLPAYDPTAATTGLAAVLLMMLALWAVSLARRDVSIVDTFWAPGFALLGAVIAHGVGSWTPRAILVLGLVVTWGLRLSIHLHLRNHGQPEDRRYAAMRARRGPPFAWQSLYVVFGLQAGLLFVIAAPIQLAVMAEPSPLGALDLVGALIALTGIALEALADWQLRRFRRDPTNRGRVLRAGLFRYSRHPNYFGNCCIFWGLQVIALSVPGGLWAVVGPALLTFLLLRVSGVALLERDIAERRPGYREYVESTSAFVPWPPRARAGCESSSAA